jgi:hypothetical protein
MDEIDGDWSQLSESEQQVAKKLIALCKLITEDFG